MFNPRLFWEFFNSSVAHMCGKGKPALSYYSGSPSGVELDCPSVSLQTRYDTVPYLLVVPFIRPAV